MFFPLAFSLPPVAQTTPSSQWIVVAAIVAGIAIVLFKSRFRTQKDPLARPPETGSLAQHRSVERQMQSLLVDLSEMSRQITAQLDTRAAKLDALIRQADEKIAALSSLPAKSDFVETHASMSSTHSRFDSAHSGQASSIAEMKIAPAFSSEQPASPYEVDPRHAEIYLLADEGRSAAQIATQLQRPSGEIELILALRERP